jgi:hypothetical protein
MIFVTVGLRKSCPCPTTGGFPKLRLPRKAAAPVDEMDVPRARLGITEENKWVL